MWSQPAIHSFTTADALPPDAPTELKVEGNLPAQLTIAWQPPENDGGSDLTSYSVHFKKSTDKVYHIQQQCVH